MLQEGVNGLPPKRLKTVSDLEKGLLENLMREKSSRISVVNVQGKSTVWSLFKRVLLDTQPTRYVQCQNCGNIMIHNNSTGTGGLKRHHCLSKLDVHNTDSGTSGTASSPTNGQLMASGALVPVSTLAPSMMPAASALASSAIAAAMAAATASHMSLPSLWASKAAAAAAAAFAATGQPSTTMASSQPSAFIAMNGINKRSNLNINTISQPTHHHQTIANHSSNNNIRNQQRTVSHIAQQHQRAHANNNNNRQSSQSKTITALPESSLLSTKIRKELAKCGALCSARDLRSPNFIDGNGFEMLAQHLINVGAKFGSVDFKQLVPPHASINDNVASIYFRIKEPVMKELAAITSCSASCGSLVDETCLTNLNGDSRPTCSSVLCTNSDGNNGGSSSSGGGSSSSGGADDDEGNFRFLSVAVRYVKGSQLLCRVLGTFFAGDMSPSEIANEVDRILVDFNVQHKVKICVIDNAASMIRESIKFPWVGCAAHNLDNILAFTLRSIREDRHLTEINRLIERCKQLDHYLNTSENVCSVKLCPFSGEKLDLIVECLKSVELAWPELNSYTNNNCVNLVKAVKSIDFNLLCQMIYTLEPFKELRDTLCDDKLPSFHLVLPTKTNLLRKCTIEDNDGPFIARLKDTLRDSIESYFDVSIFHKCATLLVPSFRNLRTTTNDYERGEIFVMIEKLEDEWAHSVRSKAIANAAREINTPTAAAYYRSMYEQQQKPPGSRYELDRYMKHQFTVNELCQPPFDFWESKRQIYPSLYEVAKLLLSTPATCLCSVNYQPTNLLQCCRGADPVSLNQLSFIRSNMDLI